MSPRHDLSSFISNILSSQQRRRRTSPLFALYNKKKQNIRQDKPMPKRSTKKAPPTDVNLPGVVQLTPLSKDVVTIELCIPGEITQQAYSNACASASKNMHIPGFPRGAALPQSLVELMNGKDTLRTQAVTTIVSDHIAACVEPALRLNEYDPVLENPPRLTLTYEQLASASYKPGEPLVFTVECDVIPPPEPEPELPFEPDVADVTEPWTTTYTSSADYEDVPVEELLVRSDPTAWNQELYESMQAEFADLVPVLGDYELRLGDACEVHLTGYPINPDGTLGLPLPSGKGGNVLGDRVTVLLKGGKYMPGLVEGLIGVRSGERITLFVNFPKVRGLFLSSR
jgi:FKBP-type peptidyl-prolyl cis-trans isomerase (trigger factor)